MKKLFRILALTLSLVMLLSLAACGDDPAETTQSGNGSPQTSPTAGGSDAPADSSPIRFAYLGPLTGDASQYGIEMRNAIELRVAQVNEAGGIDGHPVKLEVYDDKNDPKEAVNIANKIVEEGDIKVVFGPFSSTNAMAISPIFQREGILHYAITASHPDVTKAGDYIFRGVCTQDTETRLFADFAYHTLGKRKVAVLYVNNDFGASINTIFEEAFPALGGEIVAVENYMEGQTKDFTPMLTKLNAAQPDLLYIVAHYNDTATILNQAATLDITCDKMGVTSIVKSETIELAGENAEGFLALSGFVLDAPSERFQTFRQQYKDAYNGDEVDSFIMNAYDGIDIVLNAMEHVGTDIADVRDYMQGLTDYEGLAGKWSFDENRNPSKPLFPMKVENGQWVLVE